jgi:hypothetical protein
MAAVNMPIFHLPFGSLCSTTIETRQIDAE